MPDNEYPPQFAESSLAGIEGEINAYAGGESMMRSAAHASTAAPEQTKALLGGGGPFGAVPVVVTGIKSPHVEGLPGLREAMIASAIIRLVNQLPPQHPIGAELRASALKLFAAGGDKISACGRSASRPRPRAKKK
jgi:hypothetical protein